MAELRNLSRAGFTLLEALVTITLGTLIMLGVFHSSFTANKATVQTEQTLEAENLLASRFSLFLSQSQTLSLPYNETEKVQRKTTEYTITKSLVADNGNPHCARAKVTLTWNQGRVPQSREVECLTPLVDTTSGETL